MIDEYNDSRTGWARFSDDRTMRYRLSRSLDGKPLRLTDSGLILSRICVTFVMLNPSTADAFVLDPTIKRCVAFATAQGADVLQVANIFALRSTDPRELYKHSFGSRGDDRCATDEMVRACINGDVGGHRVIAGWGTHGALDHRGAVMRDLLLERTGSIFHLGLNKDGSPKHPLYLKGGTQPMEWVTS